MERKIQLIIHKRSHLVRWQVPSPMSSRSRLIIHILPFGTALNEKKGITLKRKAKMEGYDDYEMANDPKIYPKKKELGTNILQHHVGLPLTVIVLAEKTHLTSGRLALIYDYTGKKIESTMDGRRFYIISKRRDDGSCIIELLNLVCETCAFKSKEGNFLRIMNLSMGKVQRLADGKVDKYASARDESDGHLRCLLYFGPEYYDSYWEKNLVRSLFTHFEPA
ncbi:hypothetical protein DVH24_013857 [Malus domestica]|uniref:Uncharacterized protein n=1 Tax=Malus domestica TaxID=3750 RepID=A0A498JIZ0_MALDO|nr:hypothetical protein DVH24_013857 [Malus domestica]